MSITAKYTLYAICALAIALFFDTFLSTGKYPLFTLIVCGIVIVLAYVSPYIRKSY